METHIFKNKSSYAVQTNVRMKIKRPVSYPAAEAVFLFDACIRFLQKTSGTISLTVSLLHRR